MKVLIDISEDAYKNILQRSTEIQAEGYMLENAVLNGTPIDEWQTEAFKNGWKEGFGMGKQDLAHKVIKLFEKEKV